MKRRSLFAGAFGLLAARASTAPASVTSVMSCCFVKDMSTPGAKRQNFKPHPSGIRAVYGDGRLMGYYRPDELEVRYRSTAAPVLVRYGDPSLPLLASGDSPSGDWRFRVHPSTDARENERLVLAGLVDGWRFAR